jgi:chemotaxis protein CheD
MISNDGIELPKKLMVGMAELVVSQDPRLVLCAGPLGAGLGIALYDPIAKIGGLLHAMLPDSGINPHRAGSCPSLFVDTGFAAMLNRACSLKAKPERLLIYVAGGGQVLDESPSFNLGKCNQDACLRLLAQQGLKASAHHIGGLTDRTMQISLDTGEVRLQLSGNVKMKLS